MNSINLFHDTMAAMNSRLDVVLWSKCPNNSLKTTFERMQKKVKEVELMYSMFDEEAELYKLNETGSEEVTKVNPALFTMIKKCLEYHQKTKGYFNIGYRSKLELADQLVLNDDENSIAYASPAVKLDFGGIGKGIALSEIASVVKQEEELNAFVSFGGSSILTFGHHPHGDFWPLTLENDAKTTLQLNNHAVSISGFHQLGEAKQLHVVDPTEGAFKHRQKLSAVQMRCPIEAEVLSTALLVAPITYHQTIIKNFSTDNIVLQSL